MLLTFLCTLFKGTKQKLLFLSRFVLFLFEREESSIDDSTNRKMYDIFRFIIIYMAILELIGGLKSFFYLCFVLFFM